MVNDGDQSKELFLPYVQQAFSPSWENDARVFFRMGVCEMTDKMLENIPDHDHIVCPKCDYVGCERVEPTMTVKLEAAEKLASALDQIMDDMSAGTMELPKYGVCGAAWEQGKKALENYRKRKEGV